MGNPEFEPVAGEVNKGYVCTEDTIKEQPPPYSTSI